MSTKKEAPPVLHTGERQRIRHRFTHPVYPPEWALSSGGVVSVL